MVVFIENTKPGKTTKYILQTCKHWWQKYKEINWMIDIGFRGTVFSREKGKEQNWGEI